MKACGTLYQLREYDGRRATKRAFISGGDFSMKAFKRNAIYNLPFTTYWYGDIASPIAG